MSYEPIRVLGTRPFVARDEGTRLVLTGSLDGSQKAERELQRALKTIRRHRRITVDAAEASVLSGGAESWVRNVSEYLQSNKLHYLESQLALILSFNDIYRTRHPSSTFEENEM